MKVFFSCFLCLWVVTSFGPVVAEISQTNETDALRPGPRRFGQARIDALYVAETTQLEGQLTAKEETLKSGTNRKGRTLLQRRDDFECELRRSQIRSYLDRSERRWVLDAEALEEIENDLQAVVNCAEEGDTVFLDVRRFRLSRQVALQRSLTISALTNSTDLTDGAFPEASRKTVISCPRGGEGAFLVQTPTVLLANLRFEGCSVDSSASPPAIIATESCETEDTTGTVQLHHISFRENTLNETSALLMTHPSCSSLEMVDVEFMDNDCHNSVCGASLSIRNTLRDVLMENNRINSTDSSVAAMLYGPPDSVTTAESITATGNNGTLIRIEEGVLELADSTFISNGASLVEENSCIYLTNSTATIRDTRFERNSGTTGAALYASGSEVSSSRCDWIGNSGSTGGAIYLADNSTADLQRSEFAENRASGDGGGIYTASSVLIGDRLTFLNNRDTFNGAGFYCGTGSSLEMQRSTFMGNRASFGAATEFETFSTAVFRDCSFRNNSAETSGGVSYIEDSDAVFEECSFSQSRGSFGAALYSLRSNLTVTDSECINSHSDVSGGCVVARDGSRVRVRRMALEMNSADEYGGGIFVNTSAASVRDSVFTQNEAGINGGGLYGWESRVRVSNSSFTRHVARFGGATEFEFFCNATFTYCNFTRSSVETSGGDSYIEDSDATFRRCNFAQSNGSFGGALYSFGSNLTVTDSSFEGGHAVEHGGAIYAREGSNITVRRCSMTGNRADRWGGAIHANASQTWVYDSLLEQNRAGTDGGGIYGQASVVEIRDTSFAQNRANFGAALEFELNCVSQISNCSFTRNSAGTTGGVTYTEDSVALFDNCRFLRNDATFAGGLYAASSSLTVSHSECRGNSASNQGGCLFGTRGAVVAVQNVTLTENHADSNGGGIYLIGSGADISESAFIRNTGPDGGGLYAWESTVNATDLRFEHNSATFGGAVEFEFYCNATFSNCSFIAGSARTSGGVSYIEDTNVIFDRCSFLQNDGSFGAALYLYGSSDVTVADSDFRDGYARDTGGGIYASPGSTVAVLRTALENNYASEYGGGIYVNASNTFVADSVFTNNTAGVNGGGLYAWDTPLVAIANCSFTRNRADFGAALEFEFHSGTVIRECTFTDNFAQVSGGIVYDEDSNFTISDSSCSGNSAQFGGDFYLYNSRFDAENVDSVDAVGRESGGFIYGRTGSFAVLRNVSIVNAESPYGGGIHLTESHLWARDIEITNCTAARHGGALFANESSSALCFNCDLEGNTAVDCGGAVYLESQSSQLLAYQFDRCTFVNNSAQMGGAMCFQSEAGDTDCSLPDASCTFVALTDSEILRNRAAVAGGAILASQPTAVRFSCDRMRKRNALDYLTREQFMDMDVLQRDYSLCSGWSNNSAGRYGETVASHAAVVRKTIVSDRGNRTFEIPGNRYVVQNLQSGSPIPTILFEFVDAFGQGPVASLDDQPIRATMSSPDQFFCWPIEVVMENGVGNFSGVTGFRQAGVYEVRVDFDQDELAPLVLEVQIAGCAIGQVMAAVGNLCQPCSETTYNFLPNQTSPGCIPCPDDARCDNSAIRPVNGYWHQTPCSSHIQECMTERACSQPDRDAVLAQYGKNLTSCLFDEQTIREYMDDQCKKGYAGVLCGSCASDYGRSRSFRCEPCYDGFSNFLLVLSAFLILLALSGFAIRSNLATLHGAEPSPARAIRRGDPPEERIDPEPPAEMDLMERYAMGEIQVEVPGEHKPSDSEETDAIRMELEKWRVMEIFKIIVNFLQVVAVAISLNVDWTDALIAMFEAAEFLGGVTSEAAVRSVDCLISHDSAIARSAVHTAVGILVPMVAVFFYAAFWAVAMCRFAETVVYLAKRCLLSFLAVSYLTYIAITKTAVNVHYCVDVHDSFDFQSDRTTKYWAVDTSLRCYEGSHTVLAAMIGWPVLVLFSLLFPVAIFHVLLLQRRRDNLSSPWLFETAGFLYRSYRREFVFWESVILLRKAVLAVVVVFAYPLGGNLQGVLSVFVLTIALYFQIVCRPFRTEFEALNELEGLSLLVSSLTFVAGLFFNDDHANYATRVLLSVFVIICNVGLLVFLCMAFLNSSAIYLRRVMDAEKLDYAREGGTLYVICIYVKLRFQNKFRAMSGWLLGNSGARRSRNRA